MNMVRFNNIENKSNINSEDFYEILGVSRGANKKEIKEAYRKLAGIYHTDKDGGSQDNFIKVKLAYETLYNYSSRSYYDKYGKVNNTQFDIENRAKLKVVSAMDHSLSLAIQNPEKFDLILNIKKILILEMNGNKSSKESNIKTINGMRKVKKRLKKKSLGENIIVAVVEKVIEKCNSNNEDIDKNMKVLEKAIQIIEDYTYELDKNDNSTITSNFWVGISS